MAPRCALIFLLVTVAYGFGTENTVTTSRQSYSLGAKAAADILCYSRTLLKGSYMPTDVSYTNPAPGQVIKFITAAADRYSTYGFTMDVANGALGTPTGTVRLNGKNVLPYAIEIKFYCSP